MRKEKKEKRHSQALCYPEKGGESRREKEGKGTQRCLLSNLRPAKKKKEGRGKIDNLYFAGRRREERAGRGGERERFPSARSVRGKGEEERNAYCFPTAQEKPLEKEKEKGRGTTRSIRGVRNKERGKKKKRGGEKRVPSVSLFLSERGGREGSRGGKGEKGEKEMGTSERLMLSRARKKKEGEKG